MFRHAVQIRMACDGVRMRVPVELIGKDSETDPWLEELPGKALVWFPPYF